jgi:helicase
MRGRYDLCLMTYEKFANMLLANDYLLDQVGTIIIDEVQMIADESRGANLEFLLTLLRVRSRTGDEPQLIALSAVVGDTGGLERWLGARLLRREERPVPLNEGVLRGDGSFRYMDPEGEEHVEPCVWPEFRKGSSQDWLIPLARKLIQGGERFIVFRETKPETVSVARYLARELSLPPAGNAIAELPAGGPSSASAALREVLSGGVAFHNADLDRDERRVVEEHFRELDDDLRVIVATTTLAMGVNTPASSVVVVGLQHPGQVPYSVAEYKNIVGRAGRLGFTERGTSYVFALNPSEEHYVWQRYVTGKPEDLSSRFLAERTDLRSLVLRVVVAAERATGRGLRPDDVVQFLEESFGAFQQKHTYQNWSWNPIQVAEALFELKNHDLLETARDGGLRLTPLGRLAAESGIEVESVIRLVEALGSADPADLNNATLISAACLTVELDDVYFPFNKSSTRKEPVAWARELQHQRVAPSVLGAMRRSAANQHTPTERAKKSASMPTMDDGPESGRHRANHDPVRWGVRCSRTDSRRKLACSRRAPGSHEDCGAATSGARPRRTTEAPDGPLGDRLACLGGRACCTPRQPHNESRLSPACTIRTLRRGRSGSRSGRGAARTSWERRRKVGRRASRHTRPSRYPVRRDVVGSETPFARRLKT